MVAEDWTKEWERRIVNGVYPLRRFLARSNHSVVFLTECRAQNVAQAAIKILPAIPALAEAQLAHWRTVATLSHPHLIRLIDAGRCQLGGHNFLFVVMDHAEQNLAQILRGRPLTPDEVRDLLPATLDALAYLHGKNLVHGGLKPPNFLAVDDQLKLASDTIRPAGERGASIAKPSFYDPPEVRKGRISTAGDFWGLGITLVEALTQTPPAWSRERSERVPLPANFAPEFVDTVERCLERDPGQRPTAAELAVQFNVGSLAAVATPSVVAATPSATMPPSGEVPPSAVTPASAVLPVKNEPRKLRPVVTALAVCGIALGAVWAGVRLSHTHATGSQISQTAEIAPQSPPAASPPPAEENPNASIPGSPPTVLHQEIPEVSRRARASIRGVILITVRATVDRSGNVVAATLDNGASSKYFTRSAIDAAKKWKFAQAADAASRVWLLHFEFSREGTTAHSAAIQG